MADGDTIGFVLSIPMARFEVLMCIALAVPHALTEDDVYNGFFIPKGKLRDLSCASRLIVP